MYQKIETPIHASTLPMQVGARCDIPRRRPIPPLSLPAKDAPALNTSEKPRSLAEAFGNHFEVVPADSEELLSEVYRLRYQIYCLETGFEDASRFPDQLESDVYDEHAVHALLRHRRTGLWAGTVRLIKSRPHLDNSLPIQQIAADPLFFDRKRFPPEGLAEVSRFAISKSFRRRLIEFAPSNHTEETLPFNQKAVEEERRVLPHITLGLFVALIRLSKEHGIKHWYCVIETTLVRLLARYALHVTPCGPIVEYHGRRQPCYVDIDAFLDRARRERPEIWELITDNAPRLN